MDADHSARLHLTAKAQRARLTGIALMCGTTVCFALVDASAKLLSRHMDVLEVVWARYASAFLLTLLVSNPLTRPGLLRTARPGLQATRGMLLLGSTAFNFLSVRYLRLDQALAIMFSTPFLVAILSGPVLGEWVGPRRWAAIAVGFLGVLAVTRPGFGAIHPAALLSLSAAACYALYLVATPVLARTDSSDTTLFYSNLVGALAMTPILPFVWTAPHDPVHVFLMVAIGVLGSLGHYLIIRAYKLAPAFVLSPFIYTQLLWATTLGFLVFADVPDRWTLAGASIVVASGLYLLHRERVRGRR
jgi:drug/metabolite transporter (DMT)-like permease